MNEELLKQWLESGKITEDEYNEMLGKKEDKPADEPKAETEEERISRLVQASVDKITAKLGKDKAELAKQLETVKRENETIKREKLTDEERKQLELDEKDKALNERERALREKENRLYAIKAIKAAGLDDGSDKALELVDFVMDEDENAIDTKVKAFSTLVQKFVKSKVDATFKEGGREPNKGGGAAVVNPYKKETFNITEQMRIEIEKPELAAQLKAAAGVK